MSEPSERDVWRLCEEALARDEAERAAFLDEACAGDEALRHEVESLIAGQAEASGFLETPAFTPAAPLAPGSRLGAYEIVSRLGAGGMGEVYKARDTRLERVVAIKVLPAAFAGDPGRRARFEREAKTIAALTHPNICTLHDTGREVLRPSADGPRSEPIDFLVMECLEGQTLAQRLEKGKLPIAQALAIAMQIADALAAAHKHGIVHRDLKPANVMLVKPATGSASAAHVKLLDFGLAKLRRHGDQPAGSWLATASPLASAPKGSLTAEGTIVGTLHYMAPEQVEAKPVDARTDIWALGVILYEMVIGKPAFEGASAASLVAAILDHQPPPLTSLQPLAPASLDHVVATCLEKDPEARWQAASDVARELRWVAGESPAAGNAVSGIRGAAGMRERRRARHRAVLAAAAVALAIVGLALWRMGQQKSMPRLVHLTTAPGVKNFPALSPDGKQVAFMWTGEEGGSPAVYVKYIGDSDARRLTAGTAPSWSPDGRRIAFRRPLGGGKWSILTMSALGGDERKVGEMIRPTFEMSWSRDGRWLAVARTSSTETPSDNAGGLYLVPTAGGEPVRVTNPASPSLDLHPAFSPDGRHLAFARTITNAASSLFLQRLEASGMPGGTPRQVSDTRMLIGGMAWHPDGKSILFSADSAFMLSYLYRVGIKGGAVPARIELAGPRVELLSTASGVDRLVFWDRGVDWDIWRLAPKAGLEPLIRSSLCEWSPDFSPNGQRIAFTTSRNGETTEVWTANADGSNQAQLTHGPGRNQGSARWSPDGRWITFDSQGADGTFDIFVIDSAGGKPRRVTSERSNEVVPSWSRDGRWIYFSSDRTGRFESWRVAFEGGQWQHMAGPQIGIAVESVDGKRLIYRRDTGEVFAKPLDGGAEQKIIDFTSSNVAAARDGIYYWGRSSADLTVPLMFHRFSTKASTELARASVYAPGMGLAVSPDGKTVLCVSSVASGGQIMMIDNFR